MKELFAFTDDERSVLKNFSTINPSMIFNKDGFASVLQSQTIRAFYKFQHSKSFSNFGIYNTPSLIQCLNLFKNPEIENKGNHLVISEGNNKQKFYTSDMDILFNSVKCKCKGELQLMSFELYPYHQIPNDYDLEFTMSQENLSTLLKASNINDAEFMFFESEPEGIRITVGKDLESSMNSYSILLVNELVKKNTLCSPIKMNMTDLRNIVTEYEVKMSSKGISSWIGLNGVVYFIGVTKI